MGVARDITERKQAEATILDLNTSLEKKVEQRTEELRKSNLDLSDAVKNLQKTMMELKGTQDQLLQTEKLAVLGQLAAGMTHELNTPLGAIVSSNRGILDTLRNEISEIPEILTKLNEDDYKKFKIILKESLKDAEKSENLPSRAIKKELAQTLKAAGFEDFDDLSTSLIDIGVHKIGESLIDLVRTDKRKEIISVVRRCCHE